LRELFAAGNSCKTVDLVFVAACHSEVSGNAFVRAGVKHVIAVQVDETLEDHAAVTFTKQFYLAATNNHTIKEAFDIAKVVVKETSKMGQKESEKFLLLPKDKNHDVKIFSSVTKGDLVDHTLLLPPHNLPSLSPQFVGRNQEMQTTIKFGRDARTRIVTITGKLGIGKAETATAVCRYMLQRKHFPDGMVMLDMVGSKSEWTIFSQIAQVMGLNVEVKNSIKDNKTVLKSLEKRNILVIFTRIDEALSRHPEWRKGLARIIVSLLQTCPYIKLLTTSCVPVCNLLALPTQILERTVNLKPLNDKDTVSLLLKISRPIQALELTSNDTLTSAQLLPLLHDHPIIKDICRGHPGTVCTVAKHLKHHLLDGVVQLMSLNRPCEKILPQNLNPSEMSFESFWKVLSSTGVTIASDFCLHLNQHFTSTTHASRGLSSYDLQEIIGRITTSSAGEIEFWKAHKWWRIWYLPFHDTVKRILHLWDAVDPTKIHGVWLTKQTFNHYLQQRAPGTFALRLSANYAGDLSLAYVSEAGEVIHLLLEAQPEGFQLHLRDVIDVYENLEDFVHSFTSLRWVYPALEKKKAFTRAASHEKKHSFHP